ncbi:MAG: 2,3-bisphosphoglycerate-independent phosphoglycerate mutase [Candidatus Colwellbacteria bacterium]|nr:2,3-bisphosphoglycerate-independent phosphoglycerate mutase [Candidatus Colwellbacteria bacterium]
MTKRTVVLLVLDGWGIGRKDESNAIYMAAPKNFNYIRSNYLAGSLQAAGIAVGLPWNESGSSEVGHMTLGAGRVLYQDYPRISLAIRDGSFFKNMELQEAVSHALRNKTKVNLVGLLGEGSEHSSFEHLEALIKMMSDEDIPYALHLFTDGIDSPPQSAVRLLGRLPQEKIGSLSGRLFAMDKDFHWDKTKACYDAMVGAVPPTTAAHNLSALLQSLYGRGLNDTFISPLVLNEGLKISAGDAVVFFNFREDGIRQIVEMFADEEAGGKPDPAAGIFEAKKHVVPEDLYLTSFTDYGARFHMPVAFPQEKAINPLGRVLANAGKLQLRVAETQKYAHITYFFNGMDELPMQNEYRVVIPSRTEAQIDNYPEMRVKEVGARVLAAINERVYDFILVNFANADVMAHVGNTDATQKAIIAIDEQLGLLMNAVLNTDAVLIITSDHGNAEVVLNRRTGRVETEHNSSPVPICVVANGYERQKPEHYADEIEKTSIGALSDVAPTVLELMGISKPAEMTGVSLLRFLR